MFKAGKNSIYKELGIQPVIHAGGTKTTHGGTKLSYEVIQAMNLAAESFVDVLELNRKIGQYIAKITGAEAGMVTSGAASGMVLSAAACMTGNCLSSIKALPNTFGLKNEIITQKIHCGDYTNIYTFSGAKLKEIGNINSCHIQELESAITDKTAAIAYLFGPRIYPVGLSLEEVVKVAKKNGIPVIVDAAAMLPPLENLKKYINMGADLVTISGGKFINGPQSTGILFGRKNLIEAALANASPNYAIGRPHKVSKENMVGIYTALKRLETLDVKELIQCYIDRLNVVKQLITEIKNITVEIMQDAFNYSIPVLIVKFNNNWDGLEPKDILRELINGNPPIFLQYFKGLQHLVVNPISLSDDELEPLGQRINEVLKLKGKKNALTS
ncbi:MAG: aminotransferase class V-fold PLP-dependent enzyme [Alphaproteobacteria bacterium]|nr:aminotransferase class V-fold PLP-dependent enzyme [Alphaproteobacteria bacterium]